MALQSPTHPTSAWQEIKQIWTDNHWLIAVSGWLLGILTVPALMQLRVDPLGFMNNLVPEAVGILFTVLILERLAQRREEEREREEMRQRIIREMSTRDNATARRAAREATERGMLADGSLRGAFLPEAHMEAVDMSGADLRGASLWHADLSHARLARVNLERASLERAEIDNAFMYRTNLRSAFLQEANLADSDLDEADLQGANLRDANLAGVDFRETNLCGAFLYGANLVGANLDGTQFDDTTVLRTQKSSDVTNMCSPFMTLTGHRTLISAATPTRITRTSGSRTISDANSKGANRTGSSFRKNAPTPPNQHAGECAPAHALPYTNKNFRSRVRTTDSNPL